jgi:hypothetical protein
VHQDAEAACLEPADRRAQQQRVLEHPAGQRHRAEPVPIAQEQAARLDHRGHAVMEVGRDDWGGNPGR